MVMQWSVDSSTPGAIHSGRVPCHPGAAGRAASRGHGGHGWTLGLAAPTGKGMHGRFSTQSP